MCRIITYYETINRIRVIGFTDNYSINLVYQFVSAIINSAAD